MGTAGTRIIKTDVVWVGHGYKFALDGVKQAASGIEENSDARRFIWTVSGWAGTQRYAVMWTGDQAGTWENIRFHIPTLTGSGLSGQAHVSGDVDGIVGGSAETYVRDLQWKAFTSVWMTMSGWAAYDKQPWRRGEPFTSHNRKYLKLKMRLAPYLYTYSRQAHETGVPVIRAMVLEYPDDSACWGTATQYQFMSGEWFLVAPVYEDSDFRSGIYFPEGKWIDYWDGTEYTGSMTLDDYHAPLDKLPLFVKAGAIIPMWPQMLHHREKDKDPLTLDIYPYGSTSFELYEDDGVTRVYQTGEYAEQLIRCDAPASGTGDIIVTVGPSVGDFSGKLLSRGYLLEVHSATKPVNVFLNSDTLIKYSSNEELASASSGWFYDVYDRGGIVHVKTLSMPTSESFTVTLNIPSPPPPAGTSDIPKSGWKLLYVDSEETVVLDGAAANFFDDNPDTIWHTERSVGNPPHPHEIQIDLGGSYDINGMRYLPGQTGADGTIKEYEFYVSENPEDWGSPVAAGSWSYASQEEKEVSFPLKSGRYIRLVALSEVNDNVWTSGAEINVTHYVVLPPPPPEPPTPPPGPPAPPEGTYEIPKWGWSVVYVDSQETIGENGAATNFIDGNPNTIWHTEWSSSSPPHPHEVQIDLGGSFQVNGFRYLPRQVGVNGTIREYEFYVSTDRSD